MDQRKESKFHPPTNLSKNPSVSLSSLIVSGVVRFFYLWLKYFKYSNSLSQMNLPLPKWKIITNRIPVKGFDFIIILFLT
jgi:hypothetical protein